MNKITAPQAEYVQNVSDFDMGTVFRVLHGSRETFFIRTNNGIVDLTNGMFFLLGESIYLEGEQAKRVVKLVGIQVRKGTKIQLEVL